MNTYFLLALLIAIILFGVFVAFFWKKRKKTGLSEERKQYYGREIRKTSAFPSPNERIMKYDTILNHILKDHGYSGTVSDQLKEKPIIINDIETIWNLHKLRNRLTHDMDTISKDVLERKSREFEKELNTLIN